MKNENPLYESWYSAMRRHYKQNEKRTLSMFANNWILVIFFSPDLQADYSIAYKNWYEILEMFRDEKLNTQRILTKYRICVGPVPIETFCIK